jgi:hypothetical protein
MKVTINIDCTPEEARTFLGLPDVAPLQKAALDKLQAQMLKNIDAMDPEKMMETLLPSGLKGWEQMQKAFWANLAGAGGGGDETK